MIVSAGTGRVFETTAFRNEKELQDNIEKLPNLLNAISQLNQQDYPLFILKREFGVSSGSVDFLAVDADGSLYIVETKLAENPELRRAVIGQVLEYASNLSAMSYDAIAANCLKYLKKQAPLEQAIRDFYVGASDGGPMLSAGEFKKAIAENLKNGHFNIVIVANKVGLEIQKLFHFVDQETKDSLNFIVLEINKYHLDSDEVLHSGIVWAAKYVKTLFARSLIDEDAFIASKSPHVQMLIKNIDSLCQAKGLSKTANTKGLSWKHPHGGSVFVYGDLLETNWSTLPIKPGEMKELDDFKSGVIDDAKRADLKVVLTKHGLIRLELNDGVPVAKVDKFVDLASRVIERASHLNAQKS